MPQNHARTLRERTPMTRRSKLLWSAASAVVVVVVALVIVLTTGGKTQIGCVNTYVPGLFGSYTVHGCGAQARQICDTASHPPVYNSKVDILILEKACRAGHLPIG